ncbi:MAG: diaminopimelate decarboxylase [Verrucomicrobiota bacterium]|nr:diaminopimelate decarboxylase [Verrucomicrobiota bacterium]
MNAFYYRRNELYAESVLVSRLAERYGTPLYVYSRRHIQAQYRALAGAMAEVRPLICYSVKANTNAAVIRTLAAEGAGADVVSGGELFRALRAGVPVSKIVFAGVGKTGEEIEYGLRRGILFFTVESEPEIRRIAACAERLGRTARIAARVNPDVDPATHAHITTGEKENKFGVALQDVRGLCRLAARLPGIEIAGIHMHIGSQILSAAPFAEALRRTRELCAELKRAYPSFRYLDIGGGIGIDYRPGQKPLLPETYARQVAPALKKLGISVVLEPGRFLVGNAGLLVCRVQHVKHSPHKTFIVVDAAMNDLIRPLLYEAYHEVLAVRRGRRAIRADLVGPICESGDFLALDRDLPAAREGDLLAMRSAGAYGFAMASTYNSRPLAAEVMVDGRKSFLVRRRQTWRDLVRDEVIGN